MAKNRQYKKTLKMNRMIRLIVLIVILVISTGLGILHQIGTEWVPPGVDAFCPFGGIESGISLITTGVMLQRIAWSSFILLFATILTAVVFRRAFCGTLCPLGTIQELFAWLGKIFIKKPLTVPK